MLYDDRVVVLGLDDFPTYEIHVDVGGCEEVEYTGLYLRLVRTIRDGRYTVFDTESQDFVDGVVHDLSNVGEMVSAGRFTIVFDTYAEA